MINMSIQRNRKKLKNINNKSLESKNFKNNIHKTQEKPKDLVMIIGKGQLICLEV